MDKISSFLVVVLLALAPSMAFAVDVDLHGFFTTGYAQSDSSIEYLQSIDKSGTFSFASDAGEQVSAQVSNRLTTKIQLLADGAHDSTFTPKIDLAEAQYVFSSGHEVLAGQLRLPLFLISDYRFVGTLYPWTVPPPELYSVLPVGTVGTNDTFTGINFLNRLGRLGNWNLESEAFGGGSTGKFTPPQQEVDYEIKRLFGTTLSLENPVAQFRLAYLNSYNHSSTTSNSGPQGQPVTVNSSIGSLQFLTVGGRWQDDGLLVQAEGAKLFSENQKFKDVYSFYGTAGVYFMSGTFLLHETFADVIDEANSNSGLGQNSLTTGLNAIFYGNSLVVKLEWQRANPQQAAPAPGGPFGPGGPSGPALFAASAPSVLNVYYASLSASF